MRWVSGPDQAYVEPSATVQVSSEQFARVLLHLHAVLHGLGLPEASTGQLMLAVLARGLGEHDPGPRVLG